MLPDPDVRKGIWIWATACRLLVFVFNVFSAAPVAAPCVVWASVCSCAGVACAGGVVCVACGALPLAQDTPITITHVSYVGARACVRSTRTRRCLGRIQHRTWTHTPAGNASRLKTD